MNYLYRNGQSILQMHLGYAVQERSVQYHKVYASHRHYTPSEHTQLYTFFKMLLLQAHPVITSLFVK